MTDIEILMDLYDCDISQAYKYLHVTDSHFTLGVYKRGYKKGKEENIDEYTRGFDEGYNAGRNF